MDPTIKPKLKKRVYHWLASNHPYEQKYVRHVRGLVRIKVIHFKKKFISIFSKIIIKLFSHILKPYSYKINLKNRIC